jgi:hypothetical protein
MSSEKTSDQIDVAFSQEDKAIIKTVTTIYISDTAWKCVGCQETNTWTAPNGIRFGVYTAYDDIQWSGKSFSLEKIFRNTCFELDQMFPTLVKHYDALVTALKELDTFTKNWQLEQNRKLAQLDYPGKTVQNSISPAISPVVVGYHQEKKAAIATEAKIFLSDKAYDFIANQQNPAGYEGAKTSWQAPNGIWILCGPPGYYRAEWRPISRALYLEHQARGKIYSLTETTPSITPDLAEVKEAFRALAKAVRDHVPSSPPAVEKLDLSRMEKFIQ